MQRRAIRSVYGTTADVSRIPFRTNTHPPLLQPTQKSSGEAVVATPTTIYYVIHDSPSEWDTALGVMQDNSVLTNDTSMETACNVLCTA